ncbi:hypothetical protein BIU97_06285 [Curtobacterium sp. MCBA15_009]|nr:hypothetical protein BIU97_06285 [Curtobacterium sp. MCBA15_009]
MAHRPCRSGRPSSTARAFSEAEDNILLANLHGKRNAEEILVSQLTAIQRGAIGTIVGAEHSSTPSSAFTAGKD